MAAGGRAQRSGSFDPGAGDFGRRGGLELLARLVATPTDASYLAVSRGPGGTSQLVVVTEPLPELKSDPSAVAKFLDRARSAAKLDHPNIARILAVETSVDGPFVTSEYVDGRPLSELVPRAQQRALRLPLPALLRIIFDVLAALEYAHALCDANGKPLGIVHGRVSPARVIVTFEGQVKLLDFAMEGGDAGVDRFAVGLMLWEALVGHSPLAESSDAAALRRASSMGVQRVADAWPDVDPGLASVADRAVQVESRLGYASTTELREDLENCVRNRHIALPDSRFLGGLVSRVFTEDSGGLRHLVASRLGPTKRGDDAGSSSIPSLPPAAIEPKVVELESSDVFAATPDAQDTGVVETSAVSSQPPSSLSLPPREVPVRAAGGSPKVVVVAMAAALGATLATATVWLDRLGANKERPGAAPIAASAPVVAPAEDEAPETSHVVVIATPRSSSIYLDDGLVANPYVADELRSTTVHRLRVEAPGFEAKTRMITFGEDLDLEIALEPERSPSKTRRVAAPPAAAPSCKPPYVVDEVTGKKRWRIECL